MWSPWKTRWALALVKGIREPHEVKKKFFWPRWESNPRPPTKFCLIGQPKPAKSCLTDQNWTEFCSVLFDWPNLNQVLFDWPNLNQVLFDCPVATYERSSLSLTNLNWILTKLAWTKSSLIDQTWSLIGSSSLQGGSLRESWLLCKIVCLIVSLFTYRGWARWPASTSKGEF